MWAGSIVLRLGELRDVLVGVQADSDGSLSLLRALFTHWLDDSMTDELAETNPAFRVHLTPTPPGARGLRTLPHLRYGGDVLARSTDPTDVLRSLASVLGGIHERRPNDGRAWVNLRAFVREDRAVLTSTPRPHLVADRILMREGVSELVNWGVELLPDGSKIRIPSPLAEIAWTSMMAPPAPHGAFRLAGAVAFDPSATTRATDLAALASTSVSARWFTSLSALDEGGLIRPAKGRAHASEAIARLLGVPRDA